MTATEQWRTVPEWPGYDISDAGRVRSRMKYHGSTDPRLLATPPNQDGYPHVHLHDGNRSKVFKVHQLVLVAFVGERPEGLEVRHLDGDPSNNALSNLRYGTPSENVRDQLAHGTHWLARRTHCKHGHEYTPANTAIYTSAKGRPFRQCVTCNRARRARQISRRAVA